MQLSEDQQGKFVSITEAAHLAGMSVSSLYRWAAAGRLPLYKCGSRTFVERGDLVRLTRLEPAPANHSARG